jgi:hypothetical protein
MEERTKKGKNLITPNVVVTQSAPNNTPHKGTWKNIRTSLCIYTKEGMDGFFA